MLKKILAIALYFLCFIVIPGFPQISNKKIDLALFFKTSEKSRFDISPDGKYYSYFSRYEKHKNVFLENIKTKEIKRITSYADNNVRNYYWLNDSLMIILIDHHGDENHHLFTYNINSLKKEDLIYSANPL